MTHDVMQSRSRRTTYDEIAPHYDNAIRPFERWFLSRLRARTLESLPAGARTLELGTGTGLNFVYYPANTSGVATEPSRGMISIAGKKPRPANVRLVQSSAENLPFENNSFDAAFATLVFCSLASPAAAFTELRRVVKQGGSVVLLEHVRPRGVLGLIFDLLNLITVPLFDDHFNRRTASAAQLAGLGVLRVEERLLGVINLIVCRV